MSERQYAEEMIFIESCIYCFKSLSIVENNPLNYNQNGISGGRLGCDCWFGLGC